MTLPMRRDSARSLPRRAASTSTWPTGGRPGHIIGYEHEFVHAVVDFVKAASTKTKIEPNFYDGMKGMEVLEAGLRSAETGKTVDIA